MRRVVVCDAPCCSLLCGEKKKRCYVYDGCKKKEDICNREICNHFGRNGSPLLTFLRINQIQVQLFIFFSRSSPVLKTLDHGITCGTVQSTCHMISFLTTLARFVQQSVRLFATPVPSQLASKKWPFRFLPEFDLELRVRNLLAADEEHDSLVVSRMPSGVRPFFVPPFPPRMSALEK